MDSNDTNTSDTFLKLSFFSLNLSELFRVAKAAGWGQQLWLRCFANTDGALVRHSSSFKNAATGIGIAEVMFFFL